MLKGNCHCGQVRWTFETGPASVTACNCTICRRYGALWAYGYLDHDIHTKGHTGTYTRADGGDIVFHFCPDCGCVTHYVARDTDENGRKRSAVNVRMSNLEAISALPIHHFDGCESFTALASDGRTVKDLWF
ncbi:aldehyde-activating protein [Tateyamaria omphalii]|uniref:GFA family protein n=1 Tax=Tateyamaria omphalii TaxID=299262 RepID=UPI00167B1288|nr:GFA family protein [Tateyamaria omphalii]GGX42356.1 aldehyde-activating protein [Tateyamaria omphalii]